MKSKLILPFKYRTDSVGLGLDRIADCSSDEDEQCVTNKKQIERAPRRTIEVMASIINSEQDHLSKKLFGPDCRLIDFEMKDYVYFLDNVSSLEDLISGLAQLSPFADDALTVAEEMDPFSFSVFKLALVHERRLAKENGQTNINFKDSKVMDAHLPVVLPSQFMTCIPIAERSAVSLAIALLRVVETAVVRP